MRALAPIRRDGGPFALMRREMDDLWRRLLGEPSAEFELAPTPWAPRVDIVETEKELIVKADLPGIDPKEVEVTVMDELLVLRGEKKAEKEEKGKDFRRVERFAGAFYRELPLPSGVDAEKVSATFEKGVLTIAIPKKPGLLPKKIEVKALN
jgi:HSP20 family protein